MRNFFIAAALLLFVFGCPPKPPVPPAPPDLTTDAGVVAACTHNPTPRSTDVCDSYFTKEGRSCTLCGAANVGCFDMVDGVYCLNGPTCLSDPLCKYTPTQSQMDASAGAKK